MELTALTPRRHAGTAWWTRRRMVTSTAGVVGLLATACAGSGGQNSSQAQPPLVQNSTQITWTFWASQDNISFFDKNARAFEAKYPKVKVENEWVTGDYAAKIISLVSGGTPPDAMATQRPAAPEWAIKGISLALDPYLQRGGFKESEYYPNAISPFRYGGKLYSLPREVDSWTLWYNRQLFDNAGIKPPDGTWTWETFVDRAQRLTKRDGTNVQFGYAPSSYTHKYWVSLAAQNAAKLTDRESLPTRTLMEETGVTDALQWAADLRNKWRINPTKEEEEQGGGTVGLFQSGKLAMFFGESTFAIRFDSAIKDFPYDIAVPLKGKQFGTWLGGAAYSVAKDSKQRDAGVQFVMFVSGADGQRIIAKERFGTPAIKSVAASDDFLKTTPPNNKEAMRKAFDFGQGPPMTPVFNDWQTAIATELSQTWIGTRLAKDSITAAMPKVQELMKQAQDMAANLK